MEADAYRAFLKEAFIDPIRSVLIVDDDYPTFDDVLNESLQGEGAVVDAEKGWRKNPAQIKEVIDKFRAADNALIVDIHDGSNVDLGEEVEAVRHLHQSDLLVLDYQLDRTRANDGGKAIRIARSVMRNQQFNLVIVHTSENLDRVVREMLFGLIAKAAPFIQAEERDRALALIGEAEDDTPEISAALEAAMSDEHYLHFRNNGAAWPMPDSPGSPAMAAFNAVCAGAGWADPADVASVGKWALEKRETVLLPRMGGEIATSISWSLNDPKWIRTDSGFIAFSNKGHNDDLMEELLGALGAWKPRPSRLFLAKLRAQIEKFGVAAESSALGNNHVLAHWYRRLLRGDGVARELLIVESITRHSELLLDYVLPKVSDYARRLVEADAEAGDPNVVCDEYFSVDLSIAANVSRAEREHNAFVCSKKVEGYHLATGHVFQSGADLWVCLSPMCDLVPGRKKSNRFGEIGNTLPFLAVKLQPADDPRALKKVQSNRFIFLDVSGEIKAFCIASQDDEGSSPHWYTLYAVNEGVFEPSNKSFVFLKMEVAKNHRLVSKRHDAKLVSQLRYEYALNLMQKLSVSMTRVGLDFVGGK